MLTTYEFNHTAHKDDCLFIRTTRSKGEWILGVVNTFNLYACPKLTGEMCLGALPSSESYQVSVKIVSSSIINPLTESNYMELVELIRKLLCHHPRLSQVANNKNTMFYENTVNIDCHKDFDMAKQLKQIISTFVS